MTILAAPEPPRPINKHRQSNDRKSLTYGGRPRGSSNTNPSSPFKSPLPSKATEISPSSDSMSLLDSPPVASSSQLSSPPPVPVTKDSSRRKPSRDLPPADTEESMEVEDLRIDDQDEEDSDDESEHDDRPIVHSQSNFVPDDQSS